MMIRTATVDDAAAIAYIMANVAEEGSIGTEPPVDHEALRHRLRTTIAQENQERTWVLTTENNDILGQLSLRNSHASGVFLLGMALLPEARGQGAGRKLVTTALEYARSRGAHKVELEVWTDNSRAIALYAATGFEVEGLRRDHYRRRDGSLRSALLMAYRTDTPSAPTTKD